jgi:hypothetical protein
MNIVKMKIVGYDEENNSLLASFASDTTASQNPADYPALAYQPISMWPDVTDADEIAKRMAVSGMYQAHQQAIKETFESDKTRIDALKALVGQEFEYTVSSLMSVVTLENTQEII